MNRRALTQKQVVCLSTKLDVTQETIISLFNESTIPASTFFNTGIRKRITNVGDFQKKINLIKMSRASDPSLSHHIAGAW